MQASREVRGASSGSPCVWKYVQCRRQVVSKDDLSPVIGRPIRKDMRKQQDPTLGFHSRQIGCELEEPDSKMALVINLATITLVND